METHPSYLQLDRARLGAHAPETAAHVLACRICQTHLRQVESHPPALYPEIAARLSQRGSWTGLSWLRWPALVVPGALAGALVVTSVRRAVPPHGPRRTTAKGAPRVALYLKRGDAVALWDGRAPLQAGDYLQLQVDSEGFRYLAVSSPGQAAPLYSGPVDPDKPAFLPESWRVDDSPGDERLVLALSQRPLATEELQAAATRLRRDTEVWTTALTLPKTPHRQTKDTQP